MDSFEKNLGHIVIYFRSLQTRVNFFSASHLVTLVIKRPKAT